MNVIVALSIAGVITIDFLKLSKNNKRVTYLYISIVLITLLIYFLFRYEVFKDSPLEVLIDRMQPIIYWLNTKLQ